MNEKDRKTVAAALKKIRKSLRLTQEDAGKLAGVTRQAVLYLEKDGKFDDDLLRKICAAYRIHPEIFTKPFCIPASGDIDRTLRTTFNFCNEICRGLVNRDAEDFIKNLKFSDEELKKFISHIARDNGIKTENGMYSEEDLFKICSVLNECCVNSISFAMLGVGQ